MVYIALDSDNVNYQKKGRFGPFLIAYGLMVGGGLAWLILYGLNVPRYGLSFSVIVVWMAPAFVAIILTFIFMRITKNLELKREEKAMDVASRARKTAAKLMVERGYVYKAPKQASKKTMKELFDRNAIHPGFLFGIGISWLIMFGLNVYRFGARPFSLSLWLIPPMIILGMAIFATVLALREREELEWETGGR